MHLQERSPGSAVTWKEAAVDRQGGKPCRRVMPIVHHRCETLAQPHKQMTVKGALTKQHMVFSGSGHDSCVMGSSKLPLS